MLDLNSPKGSGPDIYNKQGILAQSLSLEAGLNPIELGSLPSGVYFCITDENLAEFPRQ